MSEEIKKVLEEYKNHTDNKIAEVRHHFDEKTKETKRHFDVVAENLGGKIQTLAEQVVANTEKLEEHNQRFDGIENTLEVIKLDVEFIKNELYQKISRDEFVFLEKRVSKLEAKVK